MEGAQIDGAPAPGASSRLAELYDAVTTGRLDPLEIELKDLAAEVIEGFGDPPGSFEAEERWLRQAVEGLRQLSVLAEAKARRLAPPPAVAELQPSESAAEWEPQLPPGDGRDDEGPDPAEELARRAALYERFREAAALLERQAEEWGRHRPREASSQLLQTLQEMLASAGGQEGSTVRPDALVQALARVLRRQALADKARNAPAPSMDWPRLFARVREATSEGQVAFDTLLESASDRGEVIGLFLSVLELVRTGELWMEEEPQGRIWIRRRWAS